VRARARWGALAAAALLWGASALADPPWIVDQLLPNNDERVALMAAYLRAHRTASPLPAEDAAVVTLRPRAIVLHWTAGPTAQSCVHTFAPARLAGRPELSRGGAVNVGAHFLVDRDGSVRRLLPETQATRHAIGLNHVAIGVENVGDGAKWPLTPAQVDANVRLIAELRARYPEITHLLGHHEVHLLRGSLLFEEADPAYTNRKPDPGPEFMAAVRARVGPGLAGPPPAAPG